MEKYLRKLKLFLRNKSITILMICGLIISYFIVINGIALLSEINKKQIKSDKENSNNERKFLLYKNNPNSDIYEDYEDYYESLMNMLYTLDMGKGNLSLGEHLVYIGSSLRGVYSDIIVSMSDGFDKKIVSGRIPTEEELNNKENIVLISSDIEDFIEEKNGIDIILIDNIEYKVIGVFESNDISQGRADVIMFMDTFSEEYLNKIAEDFIYFEVSVGGDITDEDYQNLVNKIIHSGRYIEEEYDDTNYENRNRELFYEIFMKVLFIFSIINCMVISNVWINSRFRELLIRKTMGYSMVQIAKLVAVDLFKYSIIAVVIAAIGQIFANNILIRNSVDMEYSLINVVYIVLSMIIIIAISIFIPLIKLGKTLPSKKING